MDALTFFDNFATADFITDRQDPATVDEQDERNVTGQLFRVLRAQQPADFHLARQISDLMTDQLEFAVRGESPLPLIFEVRRPSSHPTVCS